MIENRFIAARIIDGKPRKVIIDENGDIINRNPNKEELKGLKRESSNKQLYTDEEYLLRCLRVSYEENKRIPKVKDFVNNPKYPCYNIYVKVFGSWDNAIKEAFWGRHYNEENSCIDMVPEEDTRVRYGWALDYIKTSYYLNPNDPNLDEKERKKIKIRTYETKMDISHLNRVTLRYLNILFLEIKWFYNYMISKGAYDIDPKITKVPIKVKDKFEERDIGHLSHLMKRGIIDRAKANINTLSSMKEKGKKVGKLKFKSEANSIPLIKYGSEYKILNDEYVKIVDIDQKIKVRGLEQILKRIPEGLEIANANLVRRHEDFYLMITTYQKIDGEKIPKMIIGIDFGISKQLTLSKGIGIEYSVSINNKLRKLYKKLSRQILHSKNWYKTLNKIRKEFDRLGNIKWDIKNKIVKCLKDNCEIVCFQDENLRWMQRIYGRKMLSTGIGGIISMIKEKIHTPVQIDRFFPSTKRCCRCGHKRDVELNERVYSCYNPECGNEMDRDLNSAISIEKEGLKSVKSVGTERIELTPGEIRSSTLRMLGYLNSIPHVKASLISETGSLELLL